MGLLDQLRADNSGSPDHNRKWTGLPDLMAAVMPEYRHGKIVLVRGEVIINGSDHSRGLPRYFYAVLHSERTAATERNSTSSNHERFPAEGRAAGLRPVNMGVSRYRAEAEANYYSGPFAAWIEPEPEPLSAWIADILLNNEWDTPKTAHRII